MDLKTKLNQEHNQVSSLRKFLKINIEEVCFDESFSLKSSFKIKTILNFK
jgi:hypothetical protein